MFQPVKTLAAQPEAQLSVSSSNCPLTTGVLFGRFLKILREDKLGLVPHACVSRYSEGCKFNPHCHRNGGGRSDMQRGLS